MMSAVPGLTTLRTTSLPLPNSVAACTWGDSGGGAGGGGGGGGGDPAAHSRSGRPPPPAPPRPPQKPPQHPPETPQNPPKPPQNPPRTPPKPPHLRDRRARERALVDRREHLLQRPPQVLPHYGPHHGEGHRVRAVQAGLELLHVLRGEEGGRGRDELACFGGGREGRGVGGEGGRGGGGPGKARRAGWAFRPSESPCFLGVGVGCGVWGGRGWVEAGLELVDILKGEEGRRGRNTLTFFWGGGAGEGEGLGRRPARARRALWTAPRPSERALRGRPGCARAAPAPTPREGRGTQLDEGHAQPLCTAHSPAASHALCPAVSPPLPPPLTQLDEGHAQPLKTAAPARTPALQSYPHPHAPAPAPHPT
jgi:hypothetical protein